MTDSPTAKVLPFHRHEPAILVTKPFGLTIKGIVCPCKICGKVVEFPMEVIDDT